MDLLVVHAKQPWSDRFEFWLMQKHPRNFHATAVFILRWRQLFAFAGSSFILGGSDNKEKLLIIKTLASSNTKQTKN